MKDRPDPLGWLIVMGMTLAAPALAQRDPHIGYVYPAGGRTGTVFQATVGGQYLNGATGVLFSGTGVSARVLKEERQLTPMEQKEVTESLAKLQEKLKQGQRLTPEEAAAAEEMKARLTAFGRRLANPALGEFVTVQITVSTDAAPGRRELRLRTPAGLSNPLAFCVGLLPQVSKPDWRNIPKDRFSMDPKLEPTPPPIVLGELPVTVNGQIPPGGVDRYRFRARAGQSLVVQVQARALIPYVADAVPGWLQATLTLYDARGEELAYDDDFRFHPDPVLFFKIPEDGDYVLEVKDALFRGREDFVYRVDIGELPFITGLFPLGGRAGTEAAVALSGWNLPVDRLTLDLKHDTPGRRPVSLRHGGRPSNVMPFSVDSLPECVEAEPNDSVAKPQSVALPIIINGRVDRPGDTDVFRFAGRAGDRMVAEVQARRLDSPLDSALRLTDAGGQQLAANDDYVDKGAGLDTHHADSCLAATLPSNGWYFIHLYDAPRGGSPAHAYRLRLSAPRPDFELRLVPSSLNVRGGASAPVTVYALRKDGFTGAIELTLADAPPGFRLDVPRVPADQDHVRITLTAPPTPLDVPITLRVEGHATIEERDVVRPAVPADDMMQAFAYRHLVPAEELKVTVVGRFRPGVAARVLSSFPLRIPAGGTAVLRARVPAGPLEDRVEYELSDPPEGIAIREISRSQDGAEILLHADPAKARPGLKGNLIVRASAEAPTLEGESLPPENKRRIPFGCLPAVPFEIVAP